MSPANNILLSAVVPALLLLPHRLDTLEARVLLLAIGLQESGLGERAQIVAGGGKGPARGLWQFERAGGVTGVLQHPATREAAAALCRARRVDPVASVVWGELERDDILAAGLARLQLVPDPAPLPAFGAFEAAWQYYLRCWRPGKPHLLRWPTNYQAAMAAVA